MPHFFYAITFIMDAAMILVAHKLYLKVVSDGEEEGRAPYAPYS